MITYGDFVAEAEEARALLAHDGIEMGLVNARFLKPLDGEMLQTLLGEDRPIVIYEEVARIGGLGSLVQQTAAEQQSRCPVHTLALPDEWLYHGKRREQLHRLGLDAAGLRSYLRRLLAK